MRSPKVNKTYERENMAETAKVEIELPKAVWEAVTRICDTFKKDTNEFVTLALLSETHGMAESLLDIYVNEFFDEIQGLVKPFMPKEAIQDE